MYSAVKIEGKTLYKLARKGIEIDRPDRTVHIYDIAITSIDLPYFEVTISCSKGTYIRSLCDDIGISLGTGAHMTALERTAVGFFNIRNSFSFDDLLTAGAQFYSIDQALDNLPEIVLDDSAYRKARNGVKVFLESISPHNGEFVRMKDPGGKLFAIGRVESNIMHVERVLNLG
jgi:tRNA pseudouridine55 synthase